MENKVALFFHVLIEILKEIFEDTNKNKNQIAKIEGTIQKVKFAEPPLTTVKTEEKIVETTLSPITTEIPSIITTESSIITESPTKLSTTAPTTTTEVETTVEVTTKALPTITTTTTSTSNLEVPDLSKINIPQLPTEATMSEDDIATTPTSTAPLISYEIQKFSIAQPPTKPAALEEEDTATVLTTVIDPIIVKTTPSLINFEIPKINIPQISTKEISEISTTTTETITSTTTSTSLPSTNPPTTIAPTTTQSPSSPPSTTQEMHYDDTDDNGIPFWLKVIDGIRCSMRDCSGVLIPTRSPYEQKELKNLTMTRFIREHGLPPCPCLELKELQKVLSSPNNVNRNNNNSQR
uniref:Zonadhesin n=1 Tax=Panagrolaimus sp. PS1159 TaxID=55785 RepID=A0AC35GF36_9BILA